MEAGLAPATRITSRPAGTTLLDALTPQRQLVSLMTSQIRNSELIVFEECAHAPIYEKVEEFNQRTFSFILRYVGAVAASGAA